MNGWIRVVIVDDDVPTRVGLRTILSTASDMEVVGEAASGPEALSVVAELSPDVVLMDIQLLAGDGIETTREIMADAHDGSPRVLVLTTFDFDEYAFEAMRAGASGFLLKRTPAEELIEAVRAVAAGDELPGPDGSRRLIERFAGSPAYRRPNVFVEPLTTRESEVLQLIVGGFSNAEIAGVLMISSETVKTHVKHIYAKCGAQDRAHAVIAAYQSGLVPRPF